MRGSLFLALFRAIFLGIIPAHAGLTEGQVHHACQGRDHPRACGAHVNQCWDPTTGRGSSPRMRGSQKYQIALELASGIIPAHAGLTRGPAAPRSPAGDHPRACGAHCNSDDYNNALLGSSPRMRGSRKGTSRVTIPAGIIPAHAGLTNIAHCLSLQIRDHPRACGAHMMIIPFRYLSWGSSPRMRGSRYNRVDNIIIAGIIPAHAGLTPHNHHVRYSLRDHPRACGAHVMKKELDAYTTGSSPRMRGSRHEKVDGIGKSGIIPAHAGLTHFLKLSRLQSWDHPRACGAHLSPRSFSST